MTPKERMIRALSHEEPDRVPVGEVGADYTITERALGRETFYRAKWKEFMALWQGRRDEVVESSKRDLVDLALKFNWDFVPIFLVPSKKTRAKMPKFLDDYLWEDESGRIFKFSPETEGWPICIKEPEPTLDDIVEPGPFEPDESELELVRYVVEKLGKTHFILGRGGDGSFPCPGGMESFLARMVSEPEFVEKAIRTATKQAIDVNNILMDEGCDGMLPGSDYCSNDGPMMSPKHFRRFIYPSIKAMADAVHAKGGFFIKHTDGNVLPVMEMMIEAGIDGWQGIQPSIGMDMRMLKERFGKRISLWGGVDCGTLVAGTPEDVRRETKYALDNAKTGGGLVLVSGNTLMVGVKYENYLAMLDTLAKEGRYCQSKNK